MSKITVKNPIVELDGDEIPAETSVRGNDPEL
jgi:hypothetical protein